MCGAVLCALVIGGTVSVSHTVPLRERDILSGHANKGLPSLHEEEFSVCPSPLGSGDDLVNICALNLTVAPRDR